jgi:hypothetical protein
MKKNLQELLDWCKSKGITVKFSDSSELKDYAAMNPAAAKKLGYKDIKANEVIIDVTLPEDTQFKNLIHELVERELINDGDSYWTAHIKALKAEKWALQKAEKFVSRRKGKAPIKSVRINVSRGTGINKH